LVHRSPKPGVSKIELVVVVVLLVVFSRPTLTVMV